MAIGPISARPLEWNPPKAAVSRVPYLPGLDGMRALAVVAVMVYHANNAWLPGGFIGVEVFFVISGYLITLLLIGEHERTGRIGLREFWTRRARRLLPALFTMMAALVTYAALFDRDELGRIRGDVIAGLLYVSNWYQIWVGQGYTSRLNWVPLRHLWSLAVEEQFYLCWPLIIVGLMSLGRRRLPQVAVWLVAVAVLIALATALLFYPGHVGLPEFTPDAYWTVAGRSISKNDALYLSTITRATGLLLGAAFAMVWRPVAVVRGPLRDKARQLDLLAGVSLGVLMVLALSLHVSRIDGAGDSRLFRGGFLLVDIATLGVMAAVTHRRAAAGALLGTQTLAVIGTRSYGLYLYHWPIFQIMRDPSGAGLSVAQFMEAMAITVVVTEASYRFVETPIRRGSVSAWWHRLRDGGYDVPGRRALATVGVVVTALVAFSVASLAVADIELTPLERSLQCGQQAASGTVDANLDCPDFSVATAPAAATTLAPAVAVAGDGSDPAGTTATVAGTTAAAATPASTTTLAGAAPVVAPSTTTGGTLAPGARMAYGDSVMLGARPALLQDGFNEVDAVEGRQIYDVTPIVRQRAAAGSLPPVVVAQLGTNGAFEFSHLDHFVEAFPPTTQLFILTIREGSAVPFAAANNEAIRALPAKYPNVHVIDWATESQACPGDCFYNDGVGHLKPDGEAYYVAMINQALGG
jgi:peptidoglycan/LPS O-acetylase OafA/YrhL